MKTLVDILSQTRHLFVALILLSTSHALADESAYERVIRTGTIRCGYAVWPGLVEKDPNTGALSGFFVDFMNELGRVTELKIEWSGEYGWGDFIEAINANKIDAMCAGIWTNPLRGKFVQFSEPVAYQAVVAVVRENDKRFDADITKLNDPSVKLVVADGESALTVATTDFPKAALFSLPQRTDAAVMLTSVIHKKGDATFVDIFTAKDFQAKNPNQIRIVPAPFPQRVFGITVAIGMNELAFKSLLDNAVRQLLWMGKLEELLKKNERVPGSYLRATLPFIPHAAK